MNLIDRNIAKLTDLCRKHKVEYLYAFGSVLTEKFHENSDVDFLVKFGDVDLYHYFDNYMDLKESLEKLLNRPVDLVEEQTVKNPVLRQSIDKHKKVIYGRADTKVAA